MIDKTEAWVFHVLGNIDYIQIMKDANIYPFVTIYGFCLHSSG